MLPLTPPGEDAGWGSKDPRTDRPLIGFILRQHKALGLSPEQVQSLEKLRTDFQREAIRREADIRIAEVELGTLLKGNVVDLGDVKTKLEEIERLRAELRFARIRTIEEGKTVLSPEQRRKLQTILREPSYSQLQTELRDREEEQP